MAAGQSLAVSEPSTSAVLNGNVTVGRGANLSFVGDSFGGFSDENPVTFNGAVTVDGGTLAVDSRNVSGTVGVEIGNGGTAAFTDSLSSTVSVPVRFDSGGGTLDLAHSPLDDTGTISGFGAGDTIVAYDFSAGQYPFTTSYADRVLTIEQYAFAPEQFTFAGYYALANFDIQVGADGIDITYSPCLAAGTSIATPQGDRLVEKLAAGDHVSLAQGGQAEIVWLGTRRQHDGLVVRIRAGALGKSLPRRDLVVSTDHALYLDGVLVPAGLLANGDTVVAERWPTVTFRPCRELPRHRQPPPVRQLPDRLRPDRRRRPRTLRRARPGRRPSRRYPIAASRDRLSRAGLGAPPPARSRGSAPEPSTVLSAPTNASIIASVWNGPGVSRSRSSPRATVG